MMNTYFEMNYIFNRFISRGALTVSRGALGVEWKVGTRCRRGPESGGKFQERTKREEDGLASKHNLIPLSAMNVFTSML